MSVLVLQRYRSRYFYRSTLASVGLSHRSCIYTVTSGRKIWQAGNLKHRYKKHAFVALCAVLYLSDIHWFFSIIAVIIYVLTRYTRPVIVFFCIMTTFLSTAFILPASWYVNTDDRIFDSAWALLMHRFGYWSWYGASNVFVPYHWVTHGIAGIYADILNLDPFIATSLVIPVLAATGLAMLLVAILQQYIPLKSAIKAACLIPLMGVIATGRSISLDSSLLFGLAMVLVFSAGYSIQIGWISFCAPDLHHVSCIFFKVFYGNCRCPGRWNMGTL